MRAVSAAALTVGVAACGGEDEARLRERTADERPREEPEEQPATTAGATSTTASTKTRARVASASTTVETAAPRAAETGTAPPLDRAAIAARVLDETVTEALAAAHAAEVGASVCDAAYESAAELVRVVRERFPEEVHEMPPRELFVSHCERLPEPAQQCMVVRYAVEHEAECRRVQGTLSEDQRRQMEQLLQGR